MISAVTPSPVALASCFVLPARTSPAAKTPGSEVWGVAASDDSAYISLGGKPQAACRNGDTS